MSLQNEIRRKFEDLNTYLDDKMRSYVTISAQGGNSIIFPYPPNEEKKYLLELNKRYPDAYFIDISSLFVKYIETVGLDDFIDFYKEHEYDPDEVFISESEGVDDFFPLIMEEIKNASETSEYIFIIRTGALYGTGMSNIKLLDNEIIKSLKKPIVVMYPSTLDTSDPDNQKLKFLGFAPASKYRSFQID